MACPPGLYLIMAIMQLDDSTDDAALARKPFLKFIEQTFPEV